MLDFWNYIDTAEFFVYGIFVYWFSIPCIVLITIFICDFISKYSSFRDYLKAEKQKTTKEQIQLEIKELKEKLKEME